MTQNEISGPHFADHSIDVEVSPEIARIAPELRIIVLEANVSNTPSSAAILDLLNTLPAFVAERFTAIGDINKRPGILGTREAYKECGKDPNRYRPSQEQLTRRIFSGKSLYTVSNVVDIFNYLSVLSGYSIGAFDIDRIDGEKITLGIGRKDEPYEGIGRGSLNIEGMPVYRDATGGVGTPTSDNERTKMSPETQRLLVCINVYREDMPLQDTIDLAKELLETYCHATDIRARIVTANNSTPKSDNGEERLPLVDEEGHIIGCATRRECHSGSKLLHPVVHLHVFDSRGRLFLQKRPDWKDIQPGKWDTAVGGHVDYGEETRHALLREAREEIGIEDFTPVEIAKYIFESDREKELINVHMTITDDKPIPSDELNGGRFWEIDEIVEKLESGIFTPNFVNEFRTVLLPYLSTLR